MHHVSEDKRARKSAEKISQTLINKLADHNLCELSVSEITESSGVSRMTFYRLFDSLDDVLYYQCHCVFHTIHSELESLDLKSRQIILLGIQRWFEEEELIRILLNNRRLSILYQLFSDNMDFLQSIFKESIEMDRLETDYFLTFISFLIPALLSVWVRHNRSESPETVLSRLERTLDTVLEALGHR